ncbi:TonB-dependent receptor [Luteimonas sp. M1R5S18]|uniref:TonB-dependent receptor n=1 Tax=Luteimonas rhizosphaericola TaxID=3042024 RepID=A0ABT6JGA4_9GAMM|nr:TonB-dependent receptor [Luteimonas rhizosphaericola]MDH5829700.1 TonB-dependent receptor [Luteimonas rhizosphaericola]
MADVRIRTFPVTASALALGVSIALSGGAHAQEPAATDDDEATRTLDRISVTGSRIKRVDIEAALPVTVIRKEEIEAQGISSAEQLLMYMNIAGNGSDNLAANAGIAPADLRGNNGVSGANLRGQGADATLVLLNGRRVATHGLRGTAVDLNSIPFAAIDRVEVLRDGASAVYGTDAIGGVINFITRTDYQGAQASAFVDLTEDGGGNIYRTDFLAGGGDLDTDRWNAFMSIGARKNDVLRGNDRDFSNTFQPERGLSPDTRGTPFATIFNQAGGITGTGLVAPDGAVVNGVNTLDLPGGPGCEAGGDRMGAYDHRLWASDPANVASRYGCAWDYPAAAVIQQPLETLQAIGRATFRIDDNHQAYVEFMGSRATANRIFEPNQISSSALETAVFNPSTWYPLNERTQATYDMVYDALAGYFGEAQLDYGAPIAYRWRCLACGPREIETTTKAYRFMTGFDGSLGTWDYTLGLSRASSESESELGTGYHFVEGLEAAFAGGLLNPFLMPGQAQSPEALAALEAASAQGVVLYGGKSTVTTFDAAFTGSLGQLRGGDLQVAVGVDVRREQFEFNGDRRDAATRPAIFNAPFDDANALPEVSRDVKAVFAEIYLPFFESLDVTLAGRYDHYTGFGGTANPKVSFKWQPIDWVAVRGAYSTGFKVPEFSKLFSGITASQNNALDLADPATCPGGVVNVSVPGCGQIDPDILTGGNPALRPEESRQKSLGVVISPVDWFNMSLDWWQIERINTIRTGPDLDVLRDNYALFEDNWIRDETGEVVFIDRRFVNSGGTLMSGVELDANLRGALAGGDWNLNLNGSYLDNYQEKLFEFLPYSDNQVGQYIRYWSIPLRWKHSVAFSWARGDWSHTLSQLYRHGYRDEEPTSVANGHYVPSQWDPDVDRYITYNYSASYSGFEGMKLTFGIKNLLDEDPPFTAHKNDWASGAGWEPRIADPRGRAYTLLVEYTFW